MVGRGDVIQNLLDVEDHRQIVRIGAFIQAGDAGDITPADGGFGRMYLLPVQSHDIVHRLHGKRLHAAGIFGNQQNIQTRFGCTARDC
ncbi:hypothetical protein D3C76_944190 [compost metagenome]